MVLKLWETYVLRDSWTKLNVAPAKIMQVHVYTRENDVWISVLFKWIYHPLLARGGAN